jgi:hypothetical protein
MFGWTSTKLSHEGRKCNGTDRDSNTPPFTGNLKSGAHPAQSYLATGDQIQLTATYLKFTDLFLDPSHYMQIKVSDQRVTKNASTLDARKTVKFDYRHL